MNSELLHRLVTMHTYMRPMGSNAERAFIRRYLAPLGVSRDEYGNYFRVIGDSPVLWSSHTDTVHHTSGEQKVFLDRDGFLTSNGSCLGADDTAGVFIMCEMMRRNIPGRYVFHYGEEKGAIGSRAIADYSPEVLDGVRYAIALDRSGTDEIITHQLSARTASDAFAADLADQLNAKGMSEYAPSNRGIFTDTESYARLVSECTNISVGYYGAHSMAETLDTSHVLRLLDALCEVDVTACRATRDETLDLSKLFYDAATNTRYAVSTKTGKRSPIRTPCHFNSAAYLNAVWAEVQEDLHYRWFNDRKKGGMK